MDATKGRDFLKSQFLPPDPMEGSDQRKGLPMPPDEPPYDPAMLVPLPDPGLTPLAKPDVRRVLGDRQSRRKFVKTPLSLGDLSFLLWATQGVRARSGGRAMKTVPSAGNRHPFDTYVQAERVEGLAPGLYLYIPSPHALVPVPGAQARQADFAAQAKGCFGCAALLYWVARPYRCEWRYTKEHAPRLCALDAGHIGQNGYLAAEALGIGCCTVGGYLQSQIDALLDLDGDDAFVCYYAAFGHY